VDDEAAEKGVGIERLELIGPRRRVPGSTAKLSFSRNLGGKMKLIPGPSRKWEPIQAEFAPLYPWFFVQK